MKIIDVKGTVVGAALEKQLVETMSNLPKMNEALQDEDTYDLETVRKMIVVEVRTQNRSATVGRLLGRFKKLLARELEREVRGG